MTRVLYLSGYHPTLEYDQSLLLENLGFDWFSTGIYLDPSKPLQDPRLSTRKPILKDRNDFLIDLLKRSNPNILKASRGNTKDFINLSKEFLDHFDVILTPLPKYIIDNWEYIKNKMVIWRTVGTMQEAFEASIKPLIGKGNLHIVRASPVELKIPNCAGGICIRNFIDENIYTDWIGDQLDVLTFQSWFRERLHLGGNRLYIKLRHEFNGKLYGVQSTRHPLCLGPVSWEEQIRLYKHSRCYYYLQSPTPILLYTFLEASMAGTPIVTCGLRTAGREFTKGGEKLYEPVNFIENGVNGLCSDNTGEIISCIKELMSNEALAKTFSRNMRHLALKQFSKARAIKDWGEFFQNNL